jgi:serine/threonine-protein kinase
VGDDAAKVTDQLQRTPPAPRALTNPGATAGAAAAVEATRLRGLMRGIAASSLVTAVIVLALAGDPFAQRIHAIALGACGVVSAITSALLAKHRPIYFKLAIYVIAAQIGVLLTGYYFWGVFSTYGALVPLTIYIVAGNTTKLEAIVGTAACVVAQTGFALATVLGWIQARGLVEPVRAPLYTQIVAIVLIQAITIGAMLAGRAARRESERVIDEHNRALEQTNRAMLELSRRDAQLAEAYAEARAARDGRGADVGRFTDQVLDGIELGNVLGRGAMGEVYEATNGSEPLAVKILSPQFAADPLARERFLREAGVISAVSSPHVVRVVKVASEQDLVPYIAMERLHGTDLGEMIKQRSLLPSEDVLAIVDQLGAALDAVHKAGVVHRDLKPSNVFACGTTWKLIDFGASMWQDGGGTLTQGNIVGTPGYMAPEQARGEAVDHRCDIYAFGALIYRLVTGVPAVVPRDIPVMLQEVTYRMPPQPSQIAPGVSRDIEAVLAIALAKNPNDRFGSAGDAAAAFCAAAVDRLDPSIVERADLLLALAPWGAWLDGR